MAGLKVVHIPYKGSVPALTDVIGGQVAYAVETVAATGGFIKSGKLKTFGVTSARRSAALPDVPSLAEAADLPGYDCAAWVGYAAPAGTPRDILVKLAAEIQKAVQASDLKDRYIALGMDPSSNMPEEMGAFMRREQDRYATIIKNAGIKIEN
jgi:tripartite-type tricarboxylate transporter receptor subunit TctC